MRKKKTTRVEKQIEVTCIEKPFVFWRGSWREGIVAFIHKKQAFVQVTAGQLVLMNPSNVLKDGREVASRKKRYAEGWIVDSSGRRGYEIVKVVLDFGNLWGRGYAFYFRREGEDVGKYNRFHNAWDFDRAIDKKHSPRFFKKETAALRYAIRLAKKRVHKPRSELKKATSEVQAFEKRLEKLTR